MRLDLFQPSKKKRNEKREEDYVRNPRNAYRERLEQSKMNGLLLQLASRALACSHALETRPSTVPVPLA